MSTPDQEHGVMTNTFRILQLIVFWPGPAEHDRETMIMKNLILKIKALRDTRGQDLIEYALMAGFVAVAAGAVMPGVASSISTIFSKVASVMAIASTQGS
jgi:Flp pilus assembly pilin Flp